MNKITYMSLAVMLACNTVTGSALASDHKTIEKITIKLDFIPNLEDGLKMMMEGQSVKVAVLP